MSTKSINVTVLGSGSFGTALSVICNVPQVQITIWGNDKTVLKEIEEKRTNENYMKELSIPDDIKVSYDIEDACKDADMLFFVVPSQAVREVAQKVKYLISKDVVLVNFAKGLELKTYLRLSEVLQEEMNENPIVIVSGPSHAEELAKKNPTSLVAASKDIQFAEDIQNIFSNDYLRIYTSTDVLGVELGGIMKNIIALAAGISDGLGYHSNTKALIITRGLAEMSRLGIALGALPETFQGLSGIGDLVVTATSVFSRNWTFGNKLGKGLSFEEALKEMSMVVEGIYATQAVYAIAKKRGIELPITEAVFNVLYNQYKPNDIVTSLMSRDVKPESL